MAIILPNRYSEQKIDLVQEFRSLKLRSLNGDLSFTPSKDFIKSNFKKLEFISENFPNDIISGSLSLQIFGLLLRETNDIDILIPDKGRYPKYKNNLYGDDEVNLENRLGIINFEYKSGIFSRTNKYDVDFFEDMGSSYIEFEFNDKKLKLHNPLEVIDYKIKMSSNRKHKTDLINIFSYFENN